jgi:two-component system CheB/CheR fusion protein
MPAPPTTERRTRVLVADDNRDAAWSVAALLELAGHELQIASTGQQALTKAHDWKPAVIVLDIGLPDINGREVARRLRARPEGAELLLIAATGWGQDSDVRQSLEAGFDAHLTKPINIQQLLDMLDEQFTRRAAPPR